MKLKGKLLLGTAFAVVLSSPVLSQEAQNPPGDPTEIVVTGIRASQAASLAVKRDAEQFVDAISATDVGKFPDQDIAEALQRVTGVAITRTTAESSSSGQGSAEVTIRGFGPEFNTVLVNDRIMATTNSGREFSFDVLPSSIIQRVDIFKTSSADLTEGAIGGTINVVTQRPLDLSGIHFAADLGGQDDLNRNSPGPNLSTNFSATNDERTLGIAASLAYSDRKSQEDYVEVQGWQPEGPTGLGANGLPVGPSLINGSPTATGLGTGALSQATPGVVIPQNINFNRETAEYKRLTANATIEWRPTDRLTVTVDGLYSKYDQTTEDRYFAGYFSPYYISPQVDATNTVTSFYRPSLQFLQNNPLLAANGVSASQNDNVSTQHNSNTYSDLYGINIDWLPTDRLSLNFDAAKSTAHDDYVNPFAVVGAYSATSSPEFILNPGQSVPTFTNYGNITNPANLRLHFASVNENIIDDNITQFHLKGNYEIGLWDLKSIGFGVQYSDRTKTNASYDDNNGPFGSVYCTYCGYNVPAGAAPVTPYSLSGYLTGQSGAQNAPSNFFTFDPVAVMKYESQASVLALAPSMGATQVNGVWTANATSIANAAKLLAATASNGKYGIYTPAYDAGASSRVGEKVISGYLNSTWKGEVGTLPWLLNAGLRISHTTETSSGITQNLVSAVQNPGDTNLNIVLSNPTPLTVQQDYTDFLPSVNLKVDLSDTVVFRSAVSETVTRPTLSDLGTNNSFGGRISAATSSGGNPYLQPYYTWNVDDGVEVYASKSTFYSASAFFKSLSNFAEQSTIPVNYANNPPAGNTQPLPAYFLDTRTRNGEGGQAEGLELAATHNFDELPGLWSGFGAGANYTLVASQTNQSAGATSSCGLPGLSKHSFNINGFYEKYGFQARLAYNWRSSFLIVCNGEQGAPETQAAYGQLDFSSSYEFAKGFQVYLQGVNLLGSTQRAYSIITERFLKLDDTGTELFGGVRVKF